MSVKRKYVEHTLLFFKLIVYSPPVNILNHTEKTTLLEWLGE